MNSFENITYKKITYQVEIEIECENPKNKFTDLEMEKGIEIFIKDEVERVFSRNFYDSENNYLRINAVNFKRIENE